MILLLIIYTIVTQANPGCTRSRKIVWKLSVVKESGHAGDGQIPDRFPESSLIFWGPGECLFCLSAPGVKQTLPATYPQDCSGTGSRLPASRGGRNSPGTSRSGRRRCCPGSWCSGRRGRWHGRARGRSSTPASGHCSHRLSAETQALSRVHVASRTAFYKTRNQTAISHISGTARWWWRRSDHWIRCSSNKNHNQYVEKGFTEPRYWLTKKRSSFPQNSAIIKHKEFLYLERTLQLIDHI